MKYVRVLWYDATSEDAWTHVSEVKPHCRLMETVGLQHGENDKAVTVALSYDQEGEFISNYISIPKAWIESIEELSIKRTRKKKA